MGFWRSLINATKFAETHSKVIHRGTVLGFYTVLGSGLWIISSKDEEGSYKNRLEAWIIRQRIGKQVDD
ncbi:hypothetical protein OROHE_017314 [Orobanche hederae]